jgi:hypothetical protein
MRVPRANTGCQEPIRGAKSQYGVPRDNMLRANTGCQEPVCQEPICQEPICQEPICQEPIRGAKSHHSRNVQARVPTEQGVPYVYKYLRVSLDSKRITQLLFHNRYILSVSVHLNLFFVPESLCSYTKNREFTI